ncbi:hypothetical protein OE749_07015 [Aestuariibacter sp. AA17]|uniref:DUF305 domain-containing protein n=1 Tax=Fluctibacter corallii TaxID=2984329 RepID=A0ABT3A6X7_9ALTE|nr:hypothetical protein [Aestuariibacter sp. AA17]MCV2884440.1 hypothetical protein [Aestuariibacter sp. AA17]
MTKLLSLTAVMTLVSSAVFAHPSNHWDAYEKQSQLLVNDIENAPINVIASDAKILVRMAKEDILPAFSKANPVCEEYVQAIIDASDHMQTLSLDQIEKDYHADGKLPAMKDPVCYHAKDMLVHPATVVVMAKTEKDSTAMRESMKHEIDEVIEHFHQARPKQH